MATKPKELVAKWPPKEKFNLDGWTTLSFINLVVMNKEGRERSRAVLKKKKALKTSFPEKGGGLIREGGLNRRFMVWEGIVRFEF